MYVVLSTLWINQKSGCEYVANSDYACIITTTKTFVVGKKTHVYNFVCNIGKWGPTGDEKNIQHITTIILHNNASTHMCNVCKRTALNKPEHMQHGEFLHQNQVKEFIGKIITTSSHTPSLTTWEKIIFRVVVGRSPTNTWLSSINLAR